MKRIFYAMSFSFIFAVCGFSQERTTIKTIEERFSIYSKLLSPEKLYIQTDREVYSVGDTIWFKGYLKNASENSEYPECNYIYVEFISSLIEKDPHLNKPIAKDRIRIRVKIKRIANSFSGHIVIPEKYNTGIAIIRGYSYWMMNGEPEYMFYKNIEIRNPIKDDYVKKMKEDNVRTTSVYSDMGVENPFSKRKDTVNDIDIQFLPESGRYLYEKPSVIALKAVNNNGDGIMVSGNIYCDGKKIEEFETNDLGMGRVILTIPSEARKIYAILKHDSVRNKKFNIPLPEDNSLVINLQPDTECIRFKVSGHIPDNQMPLYVIIHDNSEIYFQVFLRDTIRWFMLEYCHLTPGINNVAIIDNNGNIYAERCFFVYPENNIKTSLSLNKKEYGAREKVDGFFEITDSTGNPINGNFAISVTDDNFAPLSSRSYDIVSYMYLGSELMTYIENPTMYFNKDILLEKRIAAMDLLMLTHGWKYYDLSQILDSKLSLPKYGKEYTQSLSGKISAFMGFTAKKSILSVVAPKINYSSIYHLDSAGYFSLNGLDFPDNTNFIMGTTNFKGKSLYMPVLNTEIFAPEYNYKKYLTRVNYDLEYKKAFFPEYYLSGDTEAYTITPSYITAYKKQSITNLSPFPRFTFKPGQLRVADELKGYEAYDVGSYVLRSFHGLRQQGDFILCRANIVSQSMNIINKGWGPVKVYINQMEASSSDLFNLPIDQVESLAALTGIDAARFNEGNESLLPRTVILVRTKDIDRSPSNVVTIKPLGWQKPIRMYTPKYETPESLRACEYARATLYWNPELVFEKGKAHISFYSSDHDVSYTIIIEGITTDGIPVFHKGKIER